MSAGGVRWGSEILRRTRFASFKERPIPRHGRKRFVERLVPESARSRVEPRRPSDGRVPHEEFPHREGARIEPHRFERAASRLRVFEFAKAPRDEV